MEGQSRKVRAQWPPERRCWELVSKLLVFNAQPDKCWEESTKMGNQKKTFRSLEIDDNYIKTQFRRLAIMII